VTHAPHFAVHALRFSPTQHVTSSELALRAGVEPGTNLFAVDLTALEHDVSQEPWVARVRARRELPATISVEVVERVPACVVVLGGLYLADRDGVVFKRATTDEAAGLPVVTGIERDVYLEETERAQNQLRAALDLLARFGEAPNRPPVGEVHFDPVQGATLITAAGGVGVRLGRLDDSLDARLQRFDQVWQALAASGERPALIHLENRTRPDRVTVKLAAR
jgi:cell division septal protein FtsQ